MKTKPLSPHGRMRKLFALFLSVSLLAGPQAFARAQTAAYAELSAVNTQNFPQVSALLDVYNANGEFISELEPAALTIYEDGQPREAGTIVESSAPIQFVTAINLGPALAVRDTNGVARFSQVVDALTAWGNALPPDSQDELSLISLSGSLINHASVKDWLISLQSFKPDFRNSTPNLQTLSIALDTASAQTSQPGMKHAALFITPHIDDPSIDHAIAPLLKKAIESKVRVFIWFIDAADQNTSPSANALKLLAIQSNGAFFSFSGKESFPDLNISVAPLRHIYTLTYQSAIRSAGEHTLGLYVKTSQGEEIPALDRSFSVDIQPPNAFFVAPPLQITRQPPADDPYNQEVLTPTQQTLDIIIEFPDGHIRDLKRATLYVDGQIAVENHTAPFDHFDWDLTPYKENSQHEIKVEVEDTLGLTKTSIGSQIAFVVIPAPSGIQVILARYRSYLILAAIGLTGMALITLLVWGRGSRRTTTIERVEIRKRLDDPLTQPVPAITELNTATRKIKTQPRQPIIPAWQQPRLSRVEAAASLIRLTNDGEPAGAAPIPLFEKELSFGTDPVQAMHVLDDLSIAPLHAKIRQIENGTFTIRDHGSVAGTWVNYEPVTREGRRLQHGDRINFGQMIYRFDLRQVPAGPEPRIVRNA